MIKAWSMSDAIVLAGSERKLKLLERANHVVSIAFLEKLHM
jgi:hypothetical protein